MKKFRLLLVMSSLLALVCSFTACSTDIADNYPTISVEVSGGDVTASSVSFTVKATGADDIYYWVEKAPAEGAEVSPLLDLDKASYLDASVDAPFEQLVEEEDLAQKTEYTIYVYAKNFAHSDYATPIKLTTTEAVVIATPKVSVLIDEAEVYEDSFLAFVTTENAEKASWMVVPKYTTGLTAAKVLADGTAITDTLNNGEVAVIVEGLEASTDYDFYVAVENQGLQVLSEVATVTTSAPTIPVITVAFSVLDVERSMNLVEAAGLPGMYIMVANPETQDIATLFMYDLTNYPDYAGYLSSGDYPALSGSYEQGTYPQASCLLADPALTNFVVGGVEYYPVGDKGVDADGNVYGINLLTAMPGQDNNLITFNVPVVDATGKEYILKGEYMGPMGYVASIATWPFNLSEWGFTAFESTTEGNVVTLTSNSLNGMFELVLTTENGNIEDNFTVGETLAGGFTSFVEGAPEFFELQSGRIAITKAENGGANDYLLIISTRGDETIMVGKSGAYKVEALEYPITITFPAAEALSVDGKRWALPSSFSEVVAGVSTAVFFVDMGVSMPGKLLVALDAESAYGAEAAGIAMLQQGMMYDYTVEATDATSGKVVLKVTDHFGDVSNVELPYSNLAAESVTVDFTNMLGNMGITACECTLYTKEVTIQ